VRQTVFNDPDHGQRLSHVLGPTQPFRVGFDVCVSVTSEGNLLGGVVFDGYLERSIQMHVASFSPTWLSRDFLWAAFDYPFNQLGVEVIFGPIASTNAHALRFDHKIGFTEHTRLLGAVPGGDLIILSMYRHECRWLDHQPRTICRGRRS
jgi:hypothetical protein